MASVSPPPSLPSPSSVPRRKLFVDRRKPRVDLAVVCSDSGIDVASVARLLHFQMTLALTGDSSARHFRLSHALVSVQELDRTKQYVTELERAKAVRAGAPLHDEHEDRAGEDESAGKGRKKGGANASKRGAARKQQAEEDLTALSPEHLKELEEERQRLMDTYLKNFEAATFTANTVAEFHNATRLVFIYELPGQEDLLIAKEDGSIGDVADAFWRVIEEVTPPDVEEIAVVWSVSDARLLKALKEPPRDPSDVKQTVDRCVQLRVILYVNDSQFIDPTLAAPHAGDSMKRGSRFSMAKKGTGRKAGSQGSDGSRGSSRIKGGKGGAKNAAAPSDSAPPNFFESGVDADEILFECQSFADFIEKQTLLQKQKADIQKVLESTKPPNSECDASLRIMVPPEEPIARLTTTNPAELPTPLEAHLNHQMALLPSIAPQNKKSAVAESASAPAAASPTNSRAAPAPAEATSAAREGGDVSRHPPLSPAPTPEPVWSILRATQTGPPSENIWINICRQKVVPSLYELASIVSIYNAWRSQKHFTELPLSLKSQYPLRLAPTFTQDKKDAFRPHKLSVEDMKVFCKGVSHDELRVRNGPLTDGGIQVYEREKLLGGEFTSYTALMALISQTTVNLNRAQPFRLVQLQNPETLPPLLADVCELQVGLQTRRPPFRVEAPGERASVGDNRGTASVTVAEKPVKAPPEEADTKKDAAPPAKGKDTKKGPAKRPGNAKHDVKPKEEEPSNPPPLAAVPKPAAWVLPLDHCHRDDVGSMNPSPQEVEWMVKQYVKKGMGSFFYSKRGCCAYPVSAKLHVEGKTGRLQPCKSEILQAVQTMREFHSSRVGGRLLPMAEEMNQKITLFRACYSFLKHLNRSSLIAAAQDPRTAPVTPSLELCDMKGNPMWEKLPQDLVVKLALPLSQEEEQLKLSVERNLTARERAHVIQRTLLVEIARAVQLLPSRTKILEETPLNIEEVISLPTALHRMASFPLRFGEHIASVYGFAAQEMDKSNINAEMAETYAAKHSKNAENVYPARRDRQFWVSGVAVPPHRRKYLIGVYPVSGCLPVDQFVAWKRWENRKTIEMEDGTSPSALGPVTFSTSAFGSSEAPKKDEPKKHGKLAAKIMEQLLGKVLDYRHLHTSKESPSETNSCSTKTVAEVSPDLEETLGSQRANEPKIPSGVDLRGFRMGKDLYLATEGRQVLYPFADAVVEIITTNYSRQCRFLCSNEVTATLHYNIPPPITDQDISELMQLLGKYSAAPEETAYLAVRFDDGLSVTVANRAKPRVRPPQRQLSKTSRTMEDRGGSVTSFARDNESVASFSSRGKVHGKEKKKKEKRGANKRQSRPSVIEMEKAQEVPPEAPPPRPQPPLCPPIAPNGDVRLWTAREELPAENGEPTVVGFSAFTSKSTLDQSSNIQKVFDEPSKEMEPPELRVEPLDITVASSNFTFHNREGDGVLWFSYSISSNGATGHQLSLPETIFCVHCNEGADSKLEASLEREVRRSVDEFSGVVVRYFESGLTQTLFPDGAVRHRVKEVGGATEGFQNPNNFLFQETPAERYCETLTLTSGVLYVRSVSTPHGPSFLGHTDLQDTVTDSFLRLNVYQEQHITYDPTNHSHTMARKDGVTVVYYYIPRAGDVAELTLDNADRLRQPSGWTANDFHPDSTVSVSTVTPLARTLNEQLRRVDTWDGTLTSTSEMAHGVSMNDMPEVYARVALHGDGTSITTFGDNVDGFEGTETCGGSGSSLGGRLDPGIAPSIASLFNDIRVVRAACQGPVRWCIESPRIPRIFLICVPDRLQQLHQTLQEWHLSFNRSGSLAETGQSVPFHQYDSFYLVFGDGSVLKRHLLSRPSRGTVVPFLETVLSRPTDTAVRIIHDNGLAVVERAVDVKRNVENAAAAAIGEGFGVFDLALGGFRLVDYLSHVTEVQNLYSPFGVSADIRPVSWETLLKQLVHETYSEHRLPTAQMERMAAQQEKEEEEERRQRAAGVCPKLVDRMRELAQEFVITNGLLKPDVLHTLEKASRTAKGLERMDFQKAFTESQTPHTGVLSSIIGRTTPIFFCQRANSEVVQFISEQAMDKIVEQEGLAEMSPDPVYLLRSTAAGEPGVQQLSLFRIGANDKANPPTYSSTTSTLLSWASEQSFRKSVVTVASEPGSLRDRIERHHKLSSFFNGMSFAAHYHHADNPLFDNTIADPSKYLGSFSRWQPRECQPPRRYLRPAARCERLANGVVEVQDDDQRQLASNATHEAVRTFLQFQPVSAAVTNTVLNAELQRHCQLADLSRYHQVMQHSFPEVPQEAVEEQKRLQQLYFAMRGSSRSANQTPLLS